MSNAAVGAFKAAHDVREGAARARRLARSISSDDAADRLLAYAEELDQRAIELEEQACALADTIAKTEALSADIRSMVEDARARLDAIKAKLRR